MPDVRSLVGIDVGVLDDDFFGGGRGFFFHSIQQPRAIRRTVEPDVDVTVARHFERSDTFNLADVRHQLAGDLLGRLLQLLGKLEGRRDRQLAELRLLGLLDRNRQIDSVSRLNVSVKGFLNPLFQ